MFKLLLLSIAIAGCKAGVLHQGYTGDIQSTPVIQQYVAEPISVAVNPLVYTAPITERKTTVVIQKKPKEVQPAPESFSYQIRVQHAKKPQEKHIHAEIVKAYVSPVYQIQQLVQPIESYQQITEINKEDPKPEARPQKTARIQTEKTTEEKAKNVNLIPQIQIPQHGGYPISYRPVVYYYPEINTHYVPNRPIQPPPKGEEDKKDNDDEIGLETLDRYQADSKEEVESPAHLKLLKSRTAHPTFEGPIIAYQSFNTRW